MKPTAKFVVALVVAVNLALIGTIFLRHQTRKHGVADAELKAASPAIHARLPQQISVLERESHGDSLSKLGDVNLFYWPGPLPSTAYSGGLVVEYLPLDNGAGQTDVEAILSNRRFLKIMENLSKMDRTAVSKMLNSELARATKDYTELFATEMERFTPHYEEEKLIGRTSITGPTFVTGNVDEGKVVIAGARLKVLALVWMCGEMGLTDCRTNVENTARIALKQRTSLYEASNLHPFFRAEMLKRASLYNRQILSSALLGVVEGNAQSTIMKELELVWRERKISTYKAVLTEFDLPVRSGAMNPDYSLGSRTLKILAPLDDARFDLLVEKCGVTP